MSTTILVIPPASNSELTPDGTYICTVEKLEPWKSENSVYADKDQVKWIFRIDRVADTESDDPDSLINKQIWGFTSLAMGRKATMRVWIEALLNREIADKEVVNPSHVIGLPAKIVFGPYVKKDGTQGHKILSVSGPKKSTKKSSTPPPAPDAESDDEFPF